MYTTQTQIEAYLKRPLIAHEVTMITTAIPAIKHYIDSYCGRDFDSTASTSYFYNGHGEKELFIDDFSSISEIAYVDEDGDVVTTFTENDDYELYPLNAAYKNSIKLRGGTFVRGTKNIKVTGSLGFASVPEAIQMIATILVARLLENPQNLKSRSIEGYSEVYGVLIDNQNKGLLTSYQKVSI